jgi:hypothetical protein
MAFSSDAGPWKVLTPSSSPQPRGIRGIYATGAGNLAVDFGEGVVTIPIAAGQFLPMGGINLVTTATTATGLFAIF